MLFVDNDQSQIFKFELAIEQFVSADEDVYFAVTAVRDDGIDFALRT